MNKTNDEITNTVIEVSLDNPHLGQLQVSNHLKKQCQIDLSASGVRNVWLRENMQIMVLRMQKQADIQGLL